MSLYLFQSIAQVCKDVTYLFKERYYLQKYLLFYKIAESIWWPGHVIPVVYIKLTENNEIPKTREELEKLDERDREIIEFRYGLGGHKELTQKELADKLSISQSYISRIEKKVIKKLKNLMKI